jgi:hypothetical protein
VLLDALLIVFVVALIGGGRPRRLGELDLRAAWLFVFALLLQAAAVAAALRGPAFFARVAPLGQVASYLLLLVGVALNWRHKALWVAGLGLALNLLVIAANGGRMPVETELVKRTGRPALMAQLEKRAKHAAAGPGTRLRFLGDNLLLPPPYPNPQVFSPGDVLITAGVCWLLLSGMGAFRLGRKG